MAELRILQAERNAALQRAVEQAALMLDLAEDKDIVYDVETQFPLEAIPAKFVFFNRSN
jgi:hypothetical protein